MVGAMEADRRSKLPGRALAGLGIAVHKLAEGDPGGFPLYSIMRNEYYFLPHFLAHYRALGVSCFVILADRCDPEFLGLLEAGNDVSILISRHHGFGDVLGLQKNGRPRRFTSVVKEAVSNDLFHSRWHLVVDADEFLVLPPAFRTIGDYVSALDRAGLSSAFASMIEFYPSTLSKRNFAVSESPFAGSPYFDEGPLFIVDDDGNFPNVGGGVRSRLLHLIRTRLAETATRDQIALSEHNGALLYKFPLLKASGPIGRRGDHRVTAVHPDRSKRRQFSELTYRFRCALAHFKFYPELDRKLEMAIAGGEYSRMSIEYRWLKLLIQTSETAELSFEGTRTYRSPDDLVEAGYMDRL